MMDAAESALVEFGLARERIRIERFGTPAGPAPSVTPSSRPSSAFAGSGQDGAGQGPRATVVIVVDGKERHLELAHDGASLLDAGLAAGAALPYACKGGVCCTCRCKVLEGEVRMDRNYTLEPQEIEAGFVLSCQAHPVTARVVVSFDER
jgi:ring-1,2-phenylacetyl-CoA epoxidase subunit PaaE